MNTRYLRYLLAALFLTAWCSNAGCGTGDNATADAGGAGNFDHPSTGFGGPIAPQGGTITGITGTSGVTGNCAAGPCTLSADTTFVQKRVTGTCASGLAIGTVNADGTVSCNTAGISGTGTTGDLTAWATSTSLGNYAGSSPAPCTVGNVTTGVSIGANGVLANTCTAIGTQGGTTGTGTANTLAMFTGPTAIGNGPLVYNGTDTITGPRVYAVSSSSSNPVFQATQSGATPSNWWMGSVIGTTTWFLGNDNAATTAMTATYAGDVTLPHNVTLGSSSGNLHTFFGTTQTTDGAGYLRHTSASGINYIESGTTQSSGSTAPLLFTDMLAAHTWGEFDASGNFLAFNNATITKKVSTSNDSSGGGYQIDGIDTLYRHGADGHLYLVNPYSVGGSGAYNVVIKPSSTGGADVLSTNGGTFTLDASANATLTGALVTGLNVDVGGTNWHTILNWNGSTNEDSYLRAGKTAGAVYVGDVNTGGVYLGGGANYSDATGGLYAGTAGDFADELQVSKVRKNAAPNSDAVGDNSGASCTGAPSWTVCNYTDTLTYATATTTSPRGLSETVGKLTASGTAGSDYRFYAKSASHGVSDVRSQTWTFSVWMKLVSGGPATLAVQLARNNFANDVTAASCSVGSSAWTRCSVVATFSATSYTDNSEIDASIFDVTTSTGAVYIYGSQIEQHNGPTPYQRNDATLDTTVSSGTLSMHAPMARFGQYEQDPDVYVRYFDDTSGAYYGLLSRAPASGGTVCVDGGTCTPASASEAITGRTLGGGAIAIHGDATAGGTAGQFDGGVNVTGTLTVPTVTGSSTLDISAFDQLTISTSDSHAVGMTLEESGFGYLDIKATGIGNAVNISSASGPVTISGQLVFGVFSPASISGMQNNWAPSGIASAIIVRIATSTVADITGISTCTVDGRYLILRNVSSNVVRLWDHDSRSSAANEFALNNDIVSLPPGEAMAITCSTNDSKWHQTALSYSPTENKYKSQHLEWNEDFMQGAANVATNVPLGAILQVILSGTGSVATGASSTNATAGRPGIMTIFTGSTNVGHAGFWTNTSDFDWTDMSGWFAATVLPGQLSNATDEFTLIVGGADNATSATQTDGCGFIYDRGNVSTGGTNTSNLDKWEVYCDKAGVRRFIMLDGSSACDGMTAVNVPVSTTNYERFTVVYSPYATPEVDFYVDQGSGRQLVCVINTSANIPNASTSQAFAVAYNILKSAGTSTVRAHIDQMDVAIDLNAPRSP